MIRRREFIAGLGSVVTWPVVARAQQPAVRVIGLLHVTSADLDSASATSIRAGLAEEGFIAGQNLAIEYRWADNQFERLPALADDLVRRRVAAIGAFGGSASALAAKRATTTIPIVFAAPNNPVELGIVASLNRPGGNLTGVAGFVDEVAGRRLAMLHELAPDAVVIGVLRNPAGADPSDDLFGMAVVDAAARLKLQLHHVAANTEAELEPVFANLAQAKVRALLATTSGPLGTWRHRVAALAAEHKILTLYARRDFVEAGGLMSYGADIPDLYRRAGIYLGRILKGEKPSDLPVLLPTKFELVINLKTAAALGLTIPETLLATADEVIQ
jgi:putative tryptophan/tyrosine transport system substrate-binding protein